MGKKKGKKYDGDQRVMTLVCVRHNCPFEECECPFGDNVGTYEYLNQEELQTFRETGLVPDYKAITRWCEGMPKPQPIPLVFPREYPFKI